MLSTLHSSSFDAINRALSTSPWPDLKVQDRGVHLGIPVGREVTLEEKFCGLWPQPIVAFIIRLKDGNRQTPETVRVGAAP